MAPEPTIRKEPRRPQADPQRREGRLRIRDGRWRSPWNPVPGRAIRRLSGGHGTRNVLEMPLPAPRFQRRLLSLLALLPAAVLQAQESDVRVERLPLSGRQPRAAVAADGTVHVVFLTGDAKASEVRHFRRTADAAAFTEPVRVDAVTGQGSAMSLGTIRGPQLACGTAGKVHVAWNGNTPSGPDGHGTPLLYSRSLDDGRTWEPSRNLLGSTRHLDGGAAVAADGTGRVVVAWHAARPDGPATEGRRAVYLAISKDDGAHFGEPVRADAEDLGACGCCGLAAGFTGGGTLRILYRSAATSMDRDVRLLEGDPGTVPWIPRRLDAWRIGACPMSSLEASPAGLAWEAGDRVRFAAPDGTVRFESAQGSAAHHPRMALRKDGETLSVWTEETGWAHGGKVRWRRTAADGRRLGEGSRDDLPAWDFAAVVAGQSGFTVLY